METTRKKPPFQLYQENVSKIQFLYFQFDNELTLPPESQSIVDLVTQEFYYRQRYQNKRFYSLKKFFFDLDYKSHPKRYPPLLYKEGLKLSHLTQAVPGSTLDNSFFIGYFKDLKTPQDAYFQNFLAKPISPFSKTIETLCISIRKILESSPPKPEVPDDPLTILSIYLNELEWLRNISGFVCELFDYARNEGLPQLKSGHLIGLVNGMRIFADDFIKKYLGLGFALVKTDDVAPPLETLQSLKSSLDTAVICFVIDLLAPLLTSMNAKLIQGDFGWKLAEKQPVRKNLIDKLLDALFLPKELDAQPPIAQRRTEPVKPITPRNKPKADENDVLEDRIIGSSLLIELYQALEKFNKELTEDLAPKTTKDGRIIDTRQGFDQFDVPQNQREINFASHALKGKLLKSELTDFPSNDQTVIKSTYWLYDRISSILTYYKFSSEGASLDRARLFLDDVRTLFFPARNEYNEIRSNGTFPQFKINVRRLFGPRMTQNHYYSSIDGISEKLDHARFSLMKEENKKPEKIKATVIPEMKD